MSAMNLHRQLPLHSGLVRIQDYVGRRCVLCDERPGFFAKDLCQGGWTTICIPCFGTYYESNNPFARWHHGYRDLGAFGRHYDDSMVAHCSMSMTWDIGAATDRRVQEIGASAVVTPGLPTGAERVAEVRRRVRARLETDPSFN